MKALKPSLLFLALCAMLLTSMKCKKDYIEKNELPPITHEGKDTFGCYVNGEIFLPRSGSMYGGAITVTKTGNKFYIKMADDFNVSRMIIIELEHNINANSLKCIKFSQGGNCSTENCTDVNNNIINLKMNETNKTISGQFNAILPSTSSCPEIRLTDGRFDLKYTEN